MSIVGQIRVTEFPRSFFFVGEVRPLQTDRLVDGRWFYPLKGKWYEVAADAVISGFDQEAIIRKGDKLRLLSWGDPSNYPKFEVWHVGWRGPYPLKHASYEALKKAIKTGHTWPVLEYSEFQW